MAVLRRLLPNLRTLAAGMAPGAERSEAAYLTRLKKLGFDTQASAALAKLTVGAAAEILNAGRPLADFLEQVEYNGRRLANHYIAPDRAGAALLAYRPARPPIHARLPAEARDRMRQARRQLHLCTMIALNHAAFTVRETEAHALLDLFRDELAGGGPLPLLGRFLSTLTLFCRAVRGRLYLFDEGSGDWTAHRGDGRSAAEAHYRLTPGANRQMSDFLDLGGLGANAGCVVDPAWLARYPSCWSVPLLDGEKLAGVFQFAFSKPYPCLPRERELLAAAAERCSLAMEKARLVRDLAASEGRVRHLARRMIQVEETERRRISRELHDEAGQSLLCIRLQLEMLERSGPALPPAALRRQLTSIRGLAERSIVETRRLIAALSPAVLEQLGLGTAIRQLVQRLRQVFPGKVSFRTGDLGVLAPEIESMIYRVVQECCHNAMRHSSASAVNVSLERADNTIRVEVQDDGVGFDVAAALRREGSYGLSGIQERVSLLGGVMEVESPRFPGSLPNTANASARFPRTVLVESRPSNGRSKRGGSSRKGVSIRIWLPVDENAGALSPKEEAARKGAEYVENTNRACG